MSIRLLALDIDGTLVNSDNEVTEATRAALQRVRAAGIEVVLATGRRYGRVLPLVEPLGLSVPVVTASGALIKNPTDHSTLFRAEFRPQVLENLLVKLSDVGYDAVLYGDTYGQGFEFYCPRLDCPQPEMIDFLTRNTGFARVEPSMMTNPPPGVFAGFAIGSRDEMLTLAADLERSLPDQLYVHVLRSPRYVGHMCEIAPHGVSKWSGIWQLAQQWNIPADAICAVGDDVNDIPMIQAAGLGIAMGNALDEVKAAAHRIAPHHDHDGIVEIVRWLID